MLRSVWKDHFISVYMPIIQSISKISSSVHIWIIHALRIVYGLIISQCFASRTVFKTGRRSNLKLIIILKEKKRNCHEKCKDISRRQYERLLENEWNSNWSCRGYFKANQYNCQEIVENIYSSKFFFQPWMLLVMSEFTASVRKVNG
jgi:hypothetical protein